MIVVPVHQSFVLSIFIRTWNDIIYKKPFVLLTLLSAFGIEIADSDMSSSTVGCLSAYEEMAFETDGAGLAPRVISGTLPSLMLRPRMLPILLLGTLTLPRTLP